MSKESSSLSLNLKIKDGKSTPEEVNEHIKSLRLESCCLTPSSNSTHGMICHEYDFCGCDIKLLINEIQALKDDKSLLLAKNKEIKDLLLRILDNPREIEKIEREIVENG